VRQVKRWRYYCDHCKKAGGSRRHMERHEQRCTLNPARHCGVCDLGAFGPAPLAELVTLAKSSGNEFKEVRGEAFKALSDAADGCPGCIWAALRQADRYANFDFKEAMKPIWDEINAERAAAVGGVAW
jgi:hypothetical protein